MNSIQTSPADYLERVEFDRVVALQSAETLGPDGKQLAESPEIFTEAHNIAQALDLALDVLKSISSGEGVPLRNYDDLSQALRMLELEGYTMTLEELVQVNLLLRDLLAVSVHMANDERGQRFPYLKEFIDEVPPAPELNAEIDKIVNDKGEIRPNASPELASIRRAMQGVQREIDNKFRGLVQKYRERDLLSDSIESFRNGRRVLTVPASNKRKVRGIVHDQSATGQTAYVEPEEVIGLNNDLFDLGNDERKEIARLLKLLSAMLRPELPRLHQFVKHRAKLDVLRAQAVVAGQYSGSRPKVVDYPHLELRDVRHPLLHLKFSREGRKVVPFTLHLHEPNRLLLLSGPNAGGKSILLKAVGLLQVMVQAGMLVPCSEESKFGVFGSFCADIGDQQSLEDDLSTYSSHLGNMRSFLKIADGETLTLIDEFGSGTDPKLGGAIAESILKELNKKRTWGVITTHYGNLKAFVYKQRGIVNGAMVFDSDTLVPTYELRVGKPGSSYAFEVATQAGLSPKLLEYARTRVQGNEHEVDKLLLDLEREKARAEDMANQLQSERDKLDKLSKTYARMQRDLEVQRKTFKLETQERALQAEARQQKELEQVVRKLRESEKSADAKEAVVLRRASRKKRETVVQDLREELNEASAKTRTKILDRPIQVGDHVKLKRGGSTGEIEELKKGKAVVRFGQLSVTTNLKDIEAVRAPIEIKRNLAKRDLRTQEGTFNPKIDVRGFRREEVLQLIQDFVDRAMINNVTTLEILHGKGNGTLRRTVREKLREYSGIKASHPAPQQGGDGVTIVQL